MKQFSPNDTDEAIGKRVEYLRIYHGMRKTELADRLNISVLRMKEIESGERKLGFKKGMKLKEIFDVSLDYVFTGDTRALTSENGDLPALNFNPDDWQIFNEFVEAYTSTPPAKRDGNLIFEGIRYSLAHHTRLIHANFNEK